MIDIGNNLLCAVAVVTAGLALCFMSWAGTRNRPQKKDDTSSSSL